MPAPSDLPTPRYEPRRSRLLDRIEAASGPADPPPATDGWRLVLAENIGYLVDEETRWRAMADLERVVGLEPERILAAGDATPATGRLRPRPRQSCPRRCER